MKKILLTLSVLGVALVSCSRDNDENIAEVVNVQQEEKLVYPASIGGSRVFTYSEEGKLDEITRKGGATKFVYEGDLIKSVDNIVFEYDDQKRLIKAGDIEYFYDKDKPYSILREVENNGTEYITEKVFDTDEKGRIVGGSGKFYHTKYDEPTYSLDYSKNNPAIETIVVEYDEKNNIFKNIKGLENIAIYMIGTGKLIDDLVGIGGENNLMLYKRFTPYRGGNIWIYENFTYNEQGYPSKYYGRDFNIDISTGNHTKGNLTWSYNVEYK